MSLVSSAQAGAAAATAILAGRAGQTPQGDMASIVSLGQLTPEKQQEAQPGSNRIYVGNVPFGFSSEDLKKIFVCFGSILTCQLLPSQENPQQHRGYGFIEFASPDAAKLAIDTMNGFEVVGKQLKVNYATALRSAAVAGSLGVGMGAQLTPLMAGSGTPGSIEGSAAPVMQGGTGANTVPLGFQPAPPASPLGPPSAVVPPAAAPSPSPAAAEQQQQQTGTGEAAAASSSPFPEKPSGEPGSSSVLLLTNTVAPEEVDDDLKEEMREECRRFGDVDAVQVEIIKGDVRIFVAFKEAGAAAAAAPQLHGRWFGGRQIKVRYYEKAAYEAGNFVFYVPHVELFYILETETPLTFFLPLDFPPPPAPSTRHPSSSSHSFSGMRACDEGYKAFAQQEQKNGGSVLHRSLCS
ncbi:RNA recognition motif-containing protein [Cyclospora cayetanensis]|uniref:RNA recognition motif-containing protein n=1 Tax=Cyclospora cayetanensis TaxID=88456 RepID=A0A1D3CYF5_9EIME|nr:RNA recognition motif-containing protein [Cyclospora cayetanensis]